MIDTIIKRAIPVRQTTTNISITSKNLTDVSKGVIAQLSKDGWHIMYNIRGDVVCIELNKDMVSPTDVRRFEKLSPYIDDNSSIELTPKVEQKMSSSIWWFFERGQMRESHWGVDL